MEAVDAGVCERTSHMPPRPSRIGDTQVTTFGHTIDICVEYEKCIENRDTSRDSEHSVLRRDR